MAARRCIESGWILAPQAVVMRNRTKRRDHVADYRSALLAERARVMDENRKELDVLVFPGRLAVDDQAPFIHDQFVALSQRRMDRRKLKLIDAALQRLEMDEFGTCGECDEPIFDQRLRILPWAEYCVRCQDRRDAGGADADEALKIIA
jgi:DnaK suppressor protein